MYSEVYTNKIHVARTVKYTQRDSAYYFKQFTEVSITETQVSIPKMNNNNNNKMFSFLRNLISGNVIVGVSTKILCAFLVFSIGKIIEYIITCLF